MYPSQCLLNNMSLQGNVGSILSFSTGGSNSSMIVIKERDIFTIFFRVLKMVAEDPFRFGNEQHRASSSLIN